MRLNLTLATHLAALRALIVLTVVLGLAYPLAVTAVGQLPGLSARADGQPHLIGQAFIDADGTPQVQYFQSRPGAYDLSASGASNLGPNSEELLTAVEERRAAVAALEGVAPSAVPPDALTASGSGLDPDITPAYAQLQIARVARERGVSSDDVARLVERNTHGRALGFLGEPTVNVVQLNQAVDRAYPYRG